MIRSIRREEVPAYRLFDKWDEDYLGLAEWWALQKSKDPSTKVGAVITNRRQEVVSMGYNGFPRGIADRPGRLENRERKYQLVVHGEVNAILFARTDLQGCRLYTWPFLPCSRCAGLVINSGIREVITVAPWLNHERWGQDFLVTLQMFQEAQLLVIFQEQWSIEDRRAWLERDLI